MKNILSSFTLGEKNIVWSKSHAAHTGFVCQAVNYIEIKNSVILSAGNIRVTSSVVS
jgi:hypothetical protein